MIDEILIFLGIIIVWSFFIQFDRLKKNKTKVIDENFIDGIKQISKFNKNENDKRDRQKSEKIAKEYISSLPKLIEKTAKNGDFWVYLYIGEGFPERISRPAAEMIIKWANQNNISAKIQENKYFIERFGTKVLLSWEEA